MKKLLACFSGGDHYYQTTKKIVEDAPRFGVDRVLVYDDYWLANKRPEYVRQNQWLRDTPTGKSTYGDLPHAAAFNYGGFKPLIILDAMERYCEPGDIVFYLDADCEPTSDLTPLYDTCSRDGGIMLFGTRVYTNEQWCKRECLAAMGQDEPRYLSAEAGAATYALFQKSACSSNHLPTQLLWEWFAYCHNPLANGCQSTGKLGLPEYPAFREHRFDQSILTNLAHKYGFKMYRMPEHGAIDDNHGCLYPSMLHQIYGHTDGPLVGKGLGSSHRNVND